MAKLYIKNTDGTFTPYSPIAVTNLDIVQGWIVALCVFIANYFAGHRVIIE